MKHRQISFTLLKKMEKNKIEKLIISIKHLHLQKKHTDDQFMLLMNYKKEYVIRMYNQMLLGVGIYEWQNYNNFISMLQNIIEDNKNLIKKHEEKIQESLKILSKHQIQLETWKYLDRIYKIKILKIKKIKEQLLNDNYFQLDILKKGQSL